MPKDQQADTTVQHLQSFASDFDKFTKLEHALGELLCERLETALLTAGLENQRKFFKDQLAELQHTFKKNTQYERELRQRSDALYKRVYKQERQIHKLLDELRDNDISAPLQHRKRTATSRLEQDKSDP